MSTTFRLPVTNEQIDGLRTRLLATRWPSYDSRDDWSLGTSSDDAKRLAQYWATQFDFDSLQQRLTALPHERVVIDDAAIHLVHVRSPRPQAVPVIITHGWPSSFLEIVPLIERMTQPERFGRCLPSGYPVVARIRVLFPSTKPRRIYWCCYRRPVGARDVVARIRAIFCQRR